MKTLQKKPSSSIYLTKSEILFDYKIACESRQVSLLGRKDVFMGRAKFGIFGDGKEVAQLCMAKVFRNGDFRSGYYRDQTFMVAIGEMTWQQFFAQLYAHADLEHDIFSAGRSMNAHFCNNWIDADGNWLNQTEMKNSIMDISSTAGQMPRAVGISYASKLYRENPALKNNKLFSKNGNEICFVTIGDASTSQGMFFETINAIGVLQVPMIISVWDDGYGISVPKKYQTTKESISEALKGFQRNKDSNGIEIINVKGWNYQGLINAYEKAAILARDEHVPALIHVEELTQPQGHSASGSHERYKSTKRLDWETEMDNINQFKNWILENDIATAEELTNIEKEAKLTAKQARDLAWKAKRKSIDLENIEIVNQLQPYAQKHKEVQELVKAYKTKQYPNKKDGVILLTKALRIAKTKKIDFKALHELKLKVDKQHSANFNSHLYSETKFSPLLVKQIKPTYATGKKLIAGWEIINNYFDSLFANNKEVIALGEDIGKIGDVNQGFAGLQDKYGKNRITDTGIRETTIIGQGIGAAMRGLRPIVEVQYIDYIYYCLATLTDDLASLRYRSAGQQKSPLIIRTRGHRLEGIWHSGSPMSVLVNSLRGIHIITPRNFVKAAAFYNTLLKGDDPALMIESLNGYRQKEYLPENINEICEPLGKVEILKEGKDITLVTYGSMCRIALEACKDLEATGISIELIDVQTLLPFDINHDIVKSLKKTNRIIFADEDMPGGTTAYMMQKVLTEQKGYFHLDSEPVCIAAKAHRPAYGSDGDYFSKPNAETIFDAAYALMHEAKPSLFP